VWSGRHIRRRPPAVGRGCRFGRRFALGTWGLSFSAKGLGLGIRRLGLGFRRLDSVFALGVSPLFRVVWVFSAGVFFSGVLREFGSVPTAVAPVAFVPGTVAFGFSSRAATTPLPVNSPALAVAAIDGCPRFSEASKALLGARRSFVLELHRNSGDVLLVCRGFFCCCLML
jgi:hypothetical protein